MGIDFPGGSDGKASAYNVGDPGSIPGLGRSLEKGMATHSSILALPPLKKGAQRNIFLGASLVAQRVKHLPVMQKTQVQSLGREDLWRRKWQPTPVFLPGESHGQRSLVGYSPWGRKESDTTERLHLT